MEPFPKNPSARTPQTVLLVDDEPEILLSIQQVLEESMPWVRVLSATHGQAGLDLLRDHGCDLILSDYRMPGMNGLEFLAEARKLSPEAPRLLITAFPDLDLAIRAINDANIEAFLTKPFRVEDLLQKVSEILEERRAELQRHESFARSFDALRRQAAIRP